MEKVSRNGAGIVENFARLSDDKTERIENSEQDMALEVPGQRQWLMTRPPHVWQPPTDVFELEDRMVVMIEIGGMRDGEFNVVLQDRRLTVSGVRTPVVHEGMAYHQIEVRYGEFRTEVSLPWPINREAVSALYRDGFLRVELPRARNQQVQVVNVEEDDK
jgi:HSP20 family protein